MNNERDVRKQILKQIPNLKSICVVSTMVILGISIIDLIPPLIMQKITDTYIVSGDTKGIIIGLIGFVVLPIISTFVSSVYKFKIAIVCRNAAQKLSMVGFKKIVSQNMAFFHDKKSAEMAEHCRRECVQYISFWIIVVPQLISSILNCLIICIYLFTIHPTLILVGILYFPASYFPSNAFAKNAKRYGERIAENNGKMNQIISDTFKYIEFVKIMNMEDNREEKLDSINRDSVKIWSKIALLDNLTFLWSNSFCNQIFLGISFVIGAWLAITENLTIGTLIVIVNYYGRFFGAAQMIMRSNYDFKKEMGMHKKLFEILSLPSLKCLQEAEITFSNKIAYSNIKFKYPTGRDVILSNLNLEIYKGEWLGIIGKSGAGKTTLFDLLLKLYDGYDGKITIDGANIENISTNSIRRKITKIPQETVLFPGTLKENLKMVAPNATDKDMMDALRKVYLIDLVNSLPNGLDTQVGENGVLLSGGEKRRIAIAQGLLRKSKIILMDEITTNIDPETSEAIRVLVRKLVDEEGITVVSVTHTLDFLTCADRVVILEKGEIVQNCNIVD